MASAAHEGMTHRVAASRTTMAATGQPRRRSRVPTKKPGGGGRLAAPPPAGAGLTALSFFVAGHSSSSPPKAATAPPTTVTMVRAGSVAVLALSACAEGGVHERPADTLTLLPYAAQLGASLAWAPLVPGRAAMDLAKPAVAWPYVILAVINYKML